MVARLTSASRRRRRVVVDGRFFFRDPTNTTVDDVKLEFAPVVEDQIEAVSLGEEKPRCSEGNEACWSQNRRDDMLYTGEF